MDMRSRKPISILVKILNIITILIRTIARPLNKLCTSRYKNQPPLKPPNHLYIAAYMPSPMPETWNTDAMKMKSGRAT